jgi:hypothetical protein
MDPVDILQTFEPISLKEMEGVKLMNRTDTKYVFPFSKFEEFMKEIKPYYKILEINGSRLCRYETLYYDSEDHKLYYEHHRGKLNRYKIRHRTYVGSGIGFLEVKFKNNKGRTIKTRIPHRDVPVGWKDESENFLITELPFDPHILRPMIWINYHRYTLVNKNGGERVTLDLGLEFQKNDRTQKLGRMVIAEVKQDKRVQSPFSDMMKKHHVREGSISKYCMGMAFTLQELKKNNFKMKIRNIQKINLCC